MSTAFDRLHPGLQRHLWDMQWRELHPIQVAAIHHIVAGRGDTLITAPTAGGKTEAAFLPILSKIADDPGPGFRAIYVGAVKALINDQFRRLEDLCERLEVPVHRWHGDVGQGARKKALKTPAGVLLITPESLEAMFVLRPTELPRLFGGLGYVVVDELHAFIGTERGAQLRSLMHRIERRCDCAPARIGLSATIADSQAACAWLRPAGPPATHLHDPDAKRQMAIRVRGYWYRQPVPKAASHSNVDRAEADATTLQEVARATVLAVHGRTTLAFANSKANIEMFADALKTETRALTLPDEVVVHHGSLSKELRESAEARLAKGSCLAVCSNTLELGIDIGVVDEVVQFTAPPSVASLAQRLGRSGRRGTPAHLRAYLTAREPTSTSSLWDRLHLDFLRGLACVELLLAGFIEPLRDQAPHRSTLVQQMLSTIAASGGMQAASLHALLAGSACFGSIGTAEFSQLLRSLGAHELIEQIPGGDLVLGMQGQRIVEHYSFFAAFKSTDEVSVEDVDRGAKIGMLPAGLIPPAGEHFLLAGKRWQVVEFDAPRKILVARRAKGRRPPVFRSGVRDVDSAVHAQMRTLAVGADVPGYIDETAREILSSIRDHATHLTDAPAMIVEAGPASAAFLWAGTRVCRTLHLCLQQQGVTSEDFDIGLQVQCPPKTLRATLRRLVDSPPDPLALARLADEKLGARLAGEKYDEFLPLEVWQRAYSTEHLDLRGAVATAEAVLRAVQGARAF